MNSKERAFFNLYSIEMKFNKYKIIIEPDEVADYKITSVEEINKIIKSGVFVYIFKGELEYKEVSELNLVVWGAGFNNNYEHEGLINEINIDKSKRR